MNCLAEEFPLTGRNYRSFVGVPALYDLVGALQFNLLVLLGMREGHTLLDIGCGSLRGGRLAIMYLLPGHYFGIEPESWLVEEGVQRNLGQELAALKEPTFLCDSDFTCTRFGRTFDFIIAQSIFSHAAPAQVERCLSQALQAMDSHSLLLATYNIGSTDYKGMTWKYPSVTYTEESFQRMSEEAGLAVCPLLCFHPGGQSWVLLAHASSARRLRRIASSLKFQSVAMPAPSGH